MVVYGPNDKLTPHFSYLEMVRSQTAVRHGINNSPSPTEIENFIELLQNTLEVIRQHFKSPIFITSGYRHSSLNDLVSKNPKSQHQYGQAADFVCAGHSPVRVWEWVVKKSNIIYDQIIMEHSSWTHLSYKSVSNRNKTSIAKMVDGKTIYMHYTKEQIMAGDYKL